MELKRTAAVALSAAALLISGAGVSHADDEPKFQNNSQILSCLTLEVLDIPIASSANNNIDCSRNYKEEIKLESVESGKDDRDDRDHDERDYERD
ncbi:hypothetical protein [Streptomyces radiopugnans]|uniref:hypothetical protein n=1 Tax=Streptomyces radiopugnans TaxID=403935 RepID=UPI003F532C50